MKHLALSTLITFSIFTAGAQAEGSAQHSQQASKHSALAVSTGAGSVAKVASAAVAVPAIIAGGASVAAGSSLITAGDRIAKSATSINSDQHHDNKTVRLTITHRTITADPAPNKVINNQSDQNQ